LGDTHQLIIRNTYIPPRQSRYAVEDAFEEIEEILTSVVDDTHNIVICGDFNAHTARLDDFVTIDHNLVPMEESTLSKMNLPDTLQKCKLPIIRKNKDNLRHDNNAIKLLELCKNTGLFIANGRYDKGEPTTTSGTLIDYTLLSPDLANKIDKFEIEEFDPVYSDVHCKMKIIIQTETKTLTKLVKKVRTDKSEIARNRAKIKRWDMSKKNVFIENVKQRVDQTMQAMNNNTDMSVNEIVKEVNSIYVSSAKESFGTYTTNSKNRKKKTFAWYNDKCHTLRKSYKYALQTHRRIKSDASLRRLISSGKTYKKQVKKAKNEYVKTPNLHIMQQKEKDPKAYWKILNDKRSKEEIEISVEELTTHFKKLHTGEDELENDGVDIAQAIENARTHAQQTINLEPLNGRISDEEIVKVSKKMKNNKACGIDQITNEYIKYSLPIILPILNKLFNKILDTGVMPEDWVTGIIVPLYKKGDKKDPANYRGITLLSCIGKMFTSILNARLSQFISDNDILLENQTGFRHGYSTMDHCFLIKHLIEICKLNKKKLYCAFVDFKQAFDRVWRQGLWFKLKNIGVSGKFYDIVLNMYQNIKSCVMVNGKMGDYFVTNLGVRQGENLSPIFFSLYLNDLENYLMVSGNTGLKYDIDVCNQLLNLFVIMYADDTVLFSNTPKGLQKVLQSFSSYCKKWKLTVNVSKTKIVVFGSRKYKGKTMFKYDDDQIEIVDEFKYLGLMFSFNGKFKVCRKYLFSQAQKAMFSLLCKCRKFDLSLKVCFELFDSLIVPILTYGSEIWSFEADQLIEKLHLKFCKYISGLKKSTPNVMVYGEFGRFPLHIFQKIKALSFWYKLVHSKNDKLSHRVYDCLIYLHREGIYSSSWLLHIENILNSCGLHYIWLTEAEDISLEWLKIVVRDILESQFITQWHENMDNSSKCDYYRNFKILFEPEMYTSLVSPKVYKFILKYRTCNHKLPIELGRYANIERHLRICQHCNMNRVGDEYHYLFECTQPDILAARLSYLPQYYQSNVYVQKFFQLMQKLDNRKVVYDLAKLIRIIFDVV